MGGHSPPEYKSVGGRKVQDVGARRTSAMSNIMTSSSDKDSFVVLRRSGGPGQYGFLVEQGHCVGPNGAPFMFGGVGMAIGVSALEATFGRPVVWATCHYLGPAVPGDQLHIDVSALREGKNLIQAQTAVSLDGKAVYSMSAALGNGREAVSHIWRRPPDIPSPGELETVPHWRGAGGLHSRFEVRPVKGRFGLDRVGNPQPEGKLIMWMRPRDAAVDLACLAILADYVPAGIGSALGMNAGGRSLDNTLRVVGVRPTDWVLVEIGIEAITRGLVHGQIALYSEDRHLMALGTQSLMLNIHDRENIGDLQNLQSDIAPTGDGGADGKGTVS